MGLILSTSLIAAFIAGVAALFAPCCVTVLLPSYFGSIFRERRKVFFMTFIFFLGILTVFIPLGLGFSALGQIFSRYHPYIFTAAGLFFLILGVILVLGKKFALPFNFHPKIEAHNIPSVFMMGIFSGIATTCCAPVLAGVLALSVLPGSFFLGIAYTLAYVLGIVSPLFVISLVIDRTRLTQKLMQATEPISYSLFGNKFRVAVPEIISGIAFLAMGVLTLLWASSGDVSTHSDLQININIWLTKLQQSMSIFIGTVPEYVWAIFFLAVLGVIARMAIKQFNEKD